MKEIDIRFANNVDTRKVFSANLLGGPRGFGDKMAIETFSNKVTPSIRTMNNFVYVNQIYEK